MSPGPAPTSTSSASALPALLSREGDAAGLKESKTASFASSFAASAAALAVDAAAVAAALMSWSSPNGFSDGSVLESVFPPAQLLRSGDCGFTRVDTCSCACSDPSSTSNREFNTTPGRVITVAPPDLKNALCSVSSSSPAYPP